MIALIGMKFYNFDNFYDQFISGGEALIIAFSYFFFNKFYYKEYKTQVTKISNAEKFTMLAIVDIVFFVLLFMII
jgi:hypothetical protein